jgi:endoglycosylceramidase
VKHGWLLAFVLVGGCGDDDVPACKGIVCDGAIRDAEGRAVVLRGVNLAGVHKNAPYTDDYTPADYVRLRADWGMTAIRFLITWSAVEPNPGEFDDAYLAWVKERMAWAHDAGLAVVIDMHQDVYGEGFGFDGAPKWTCDVANYEGFVAKQPWGINYADPKVMACFDHLWTDAGTQREMAAAWRHVAEVLADEPAIIGFDPINEPSWGSQSIATFEPMLLQPFYEQMIGAVRESAPHWVAFVEPSSTRALGFSTKLVPFESPDIVYAPHLYDVSAESTQMFDPAKASALIETALDLQRDAEHLGTPMWIGEYGGNGTDPQIAAYMGAIYDGVSSVGAGSMSWAYDKGEGYCLLDAQGQEVAPLVGAVVRPAPALVAGRPIAWTYDPASRAFELQWHADASVSASTVILAPSRLYPAGMNIECGGCAVEVVGNEVRLGAVSGDPAIARITPR